MKPPLPLRILPLQLRQSIYFRRYRHKYAEWSGLFTAARLAACPAMTMYDLIPGDEISGSVAFLGFYEQELTKRMAREALKGGLLVDVGANMGYFALLWAGLSRSGRVVAFEASSRNVSLLTNNLRQNQCEDRVKVIAKAAGHRNGRVTFDMGPSEQTGWGGIAAGAPENSVVVPMVRLDEELPGAEIAVLKIDTEGADALVLLGCERLLKARKVRMIYFEVNPDKMERIGLAQHEAQDFLRTVNYECQSLAGSETEWCAYPASEENAVAAR